MLVLSILSSTPRLFVLLWAEGVSGGHRQRPLQWQQAQPPGMLHCSNTVTLGRNKPFTRLFNKSGVLSNKKMRTIYTADGSSLLQFCFVDFELYCYNCNSK